MQDYEEKRARSGVGGNQKEEGVGLAEGSGGALRAASGAPLTDAASEPRPSSERRGQEVEIASGGGGPRTLEPRAYLLQHFLGPGPSPTKLRGPTPGTSDQGRQAKPGPTGLNHTISSPGTRSLGPAPTLGSTTSTCDSTTQEPHPPKPT